MTTRPHSNTSFVPAPPSPNSTTALALPLDAGFGQEDDFVVRPDRMGSLYLEWMTGKLKTIELETTIGAHVPAKLHPALDQRCADLGLRQYVVQKESLGPDGQPKQIPYWALNSGGRTCSLFIIAHGIKMNKDPQDRYGVAYGWEVVKDKKGHPVRKRNSQEFKRRRTVQFRAYIQELFPFSEWFAVNIYGYLADDILAAMTEQYRVMDRYDAMMRAQDKEITAPFWGFSIPLVPGAPRRVEYRDGDEQQGTTIIPMVAQIPKGEMTVEYLNAHRIPEGLQNKLKGLLTETWEWSVKRSEEISSDGAPQTEVSVEEVPPESTAKAPTYVVDAMSYASATFMAAEPAEPPAPSIVATLPPAPVNDPYIGEAQVRFVRELCGNQPAIIEAWCQRFGVTDVSHLRSSQFIELYNLLMQDQHSV